MAIQPEDELDDRLAAMTPADWRPLLDLRPRMAETSEFAVLSGQHFVWADVVAEFHQLVYDMEIVVVFDWSSWTDGRAALNDDTYDFTQMSLAELCKVITTVVRAERFNEGFLPRTFSNGTMSRILDAIEGHTQPPKT